MVSAFTFSFYDKIINLILPPNIHFYSKLMSTFGNKIKKAVIMGNVFMERSLDWLKTVLD